MDGPRYDVAYITKAIELGLVALLALDVARRDDNPIDRIRDEIRSQHRLTVPRRVARSGSRL